METISMNPRTVAILRAVAAGRAQLSCSCVPDLFIDGIACCDQFTAHTLAGAGLIRHTRPGAIGQRVSAALTVAGEAAISSAQSTAA